MSDDPYSNPSAGSGSRDGSLRGPAGSRGAGAGPPQRIPSSSGVPPSRSSGSGGHGGGSGVPGTHGSGPGQTAPRRRVSLDERPYGANSPRVENVRGQRQRGAEGKDKHARPRPQPRSAHAPSSSYRVSNRGAYQGGSAYAGAGKQHFVSRQPKRSARTRRKRMFTFLALLLVVCVIGFGGWGLFLKRSIMVNINGDSYSLKASTTYNDLLEQGYVSVKNGDLLAVDYQILGVGGGEPFTITRNGKAITDYDKRLRNKSQIEILDGSNQCEPADITETVAPYSLELIGDNTVGDVGLVMNEGADGVSRTSVGHITNRTFTEMSEKPQNKLVYYYYPYEVIDSDSKKLCLIFNGGPSQKATEEILALLKENDAKATFFMLGTYAEQNNASAKDIVKAGMEVGSNSYSFGSSISSYGDLRQATDEGILSEVTKGFAAIEEQTGTTTSMFCAPFGNFGAHMWQVLHDTVSVDVHWNVDSQDGISNDEALIAETIDTYAMNGSIILCHDRGENAEALVAALKTALPALKEEGYEFITISELVELTKPTLEEAQASTHTRTILALS